MISVKNVTKRFGSAVVVDDVSIEIPRGGLTALIGPNGAGKSTLLGVISRLINADSGRVELDGVDVHRTKSDQLARKLSILRQDNHLDARLTVEDLVAFGRYPYSKGRLSAEDREHVERALTYMELHPFRTRFLDQLSGGQRQRAFVAMVLCQDTDYLLLDEPLNNLDMRHSIGMMQLLHRIANELGKTVVVVLHDINFASWYADSIVAMRDGKVIYHAGPDVVITPQSLLDVYDVDVHVESIQGKRVGVYYGAMNIPAAGSGRVSAHEFHR